MDRITLLLVEDNDDDAILIRENLSEIDAVQFEVIHATSLADTYRLLEEKRYDVVLLDLSLPDSSGMETFYRLSEQAPHLPIVILTGLTDDELATHLMKSGAQDYLIKGKDDGISLYRSIRYAIERHRLMQNLKEKTEQLEKSESQLEELITKNADAIIVVDNKNNITFTNPAARKLFTNRLDLIEGSFNFEFAVNELSVIEFSNEGDSKVFIELQAAEIEWESKEGYILTLRDVTARKKLETALLHSKGMLQLVLDNIPARVFWKDLNFKFIGCNRAFAKDAGVAHPRDLIGKDDFELVWRQSANLYRQDDTEVIKSNKPKLNFEEPQVREGMKSLWLETSKMPLHDQNNQVMGVLGVYEDITQRKEAEQKLKKTLRNFEEQKNVLQAILNSIHDGVVVADESGEFKIFNPAAKKILGFITDGKEPSDWLREYGIYQEDGKTPVPPEESVLVRAIRGEHVKDKVHFIKNKYNEKGVWINIGGSPVKDRFGNNLGGVVIIKDITAQRENEEQERKLQERIQHGQKLESLGILAGGIAHDFNNLLMTILGNTDFALMEINRESPAREYLNQIEITTKRASELTNQMLAYSGKGKFVIEPIDFSRLVEEMDQLMTVSISKKVVLNQNLEPNLPSVEADATQLRQIVMNLITNANEAIGDRSGTISISTGFIECDAEYLNTTLSSFELDPGYYVFVEVSDTGCGMSKDTVKNIFDPFFTTKFTGRGLGLAATLGIVRGHRGAIKVYTEEGKGTTFKIMLPASDKTPISHNKSNDVIHDWKPDGTILIVDDEETICTLAKKYLETLGFKVMIALDGREGVDKYEQYHDAISLVLLDMTMPHMDGEQAFRHMRQINEDVKVILCSGYTEADATSRFNGKKLAGFIQKPYKMSDLTKMIKDVLVKE